MGQLIGGTSGGSSSSNPVVYGATNGNTFNGSTTYIDDSTKALTLTGSQFTFSFETWFTGTLTNFFLRVVPNTGTLSAYEASAYSEYMGSTYVRFFNVNNSTSGTPNLSISGGGNNGTFHVGFSMDIRMASSSTYTFTPGYQSTQAQTLYRRLFTGQVTG